MRSLLCFRLDIPVVVSGHWRLAGMEFGELGQELLARLDAVRIGAGRLDGADVKALLRIVETDTLGALVWVNNIDLGAL